MPLTTWGYWSAGPEPLKVEVDGVTYRRLERLPRNAREGDLIRIGDATDPRQYHSTFVTVVNVASWPEETRGWRRYAPHCTIYFRLRPEDDTWRWRSWGGKLDYWDEQTKERIFVYRKEEVRAM